MQSLFTSKKFSVIWLLVRLYLGYEWLVAGWEKVTDAKGIWVGSKAGVALGGFLQGALKTRAQGAHADMAFGWYKSFVQGFALPNATLFSYLVSFGELLVGVALILGAVTTLAAFFAALMNFSYMLAGSSGVNPMYFLLAVLIIAAGANAGYYGLDRYILPLLQRKSSAKSATS